MLQGAAKPRLLIDFYLGLFGGGRRSFRLCVFNYKIKCEIYRQVDVAVTLANASPTLHLSTK
jgi:hypothetical protein